MKIRLRARRISGNDPVTFRNPNGDPIVLEQIGDQSQELEDNFAYKLCAANADILEIAVKVLQPPKKPAIDFGVELTKA